MITMNEQIILFRRQLKKTLGPMRYEHSLSVSFMCVSLAMRYQYDLKKAELAGLLHDCAKRYTDSQLIRHCEKHHLALTEEELSAPSVIHAKYGAWMAEHKFGIQDPDILSAIRCHTTGKPEMTTLDKILYISDYIEPRRDKAADLPKMRCLAFQDLDQTMFEILDSTLQYLGKKGVSIDSSTKEAHRYFDALTKAEREKGEH